MYADKLSAKLARWRCPGESLRLLIRHDDPDREFDYVAGAEDALQRAADRDWTVVSMKDDWATVFPPA